LASKLRDGQMVVIDDLSLASPKTKDMAGILRALKCDGAKVLVTTAARDVNVYKSARNIAGVTVQPVSGLNALNVLAPHKLLVTKAALDAIRKRAARTAEAAG
ncbi:MAG TPA: uL4 family ribosomal protein, partial [Pirellulales bacterium]|nr:uL4 family ribosomal protein [Pirellulales bacterium]